MEIKSHGLTHVGKQRQHNEDAFLVADEAKLYLVADGMGGHVAGEVASRVAVETIQTFIAETAGADKNRTWPFPFEPAISLEGNRLKAAFRLANRQLANAMADKADLRGMATTASAVLAGRKSACLAHVGDSRIYAMRNGSLEQLTHDHSWVEEQVRAGTLTEAAARQHPWRNVVTRALSGGSDPDIDTVEIAPEPAERFLLCSDGLSGVVGREIIERTLGDRSLTLDQICDRLVAAANEGGGPDNVTALVVEIAAGDAE